MLRRAFQFCQSGRLDTSRIFSGGVTSCRPTSSDTWPPRNQGNIGYPSSSSGRFRRRWNLRRRSGCAHLNCNETEAPLYIAVLGDAPAAKGRTATRCVVVPTSAAIGAALCANRAETTSSSFITVEGEEEMDVKGNAKLASTYWYLESTPELMSNIAGATEAFFAGGAT